MADEEGPPLLIVEDDFLIATVMEEALGSAGFAVCGVAASADDAVALARTNKPALVVMDIRLVGKRDGIEAALELYRELGIRCIFASAHVDETTRMKAAAAAPLGWIAKPYGMPSLVELIRKALKELKNN